MIGCSGSRAPSLERFDSIRTCLQKRGSRVCEIPAFRTFQKRFRAGGSMACGWCFEEHSVRLPFLCSVGVQFAALFSSLCSKFYPSGSTWGMMGCQCPMSRRRLCAICLQRASAWAPRLPQARHRRQFSRWMIRAKAPSTVIFRARIQRWPSREDTRWATAARTSG